MEPLTTHLPGLELTTIRDGRRVVQIHQYHQLGLTTSVTVGPWTAIKIALAMIATAVCVLGRQLCEARDD